MWWEETDYIRILSSIRLSVVRNAIVGEKKRAAIRVQQA